MWRTNRKYNDNNNEREKMVIIISISISIVHTWYTRCTHMGLKKFFLLSPRLGATATRNLVMVWLIIGQHQNTVQNNCRGNRITHMWTTSTTKMIVRRKLLTRKIKYFPHLWRDCASFDDTGILWPVVFDRSRWDLGRTNAVRYRFVFLKWKQDEHNNNDLHFVKIGRVNYLLRKHGEQSRRMV